MIKIWSIIPTSLVLFRFNSLVNNNCNHLQNSLIWGGRNIITNIINIYSKNITGPKTVPCGTPDNTPLP